MLATFHARWRAIPARGHVPRVPAPHHPRWPVELRTGAALVELHLDEIARALHPIEGARTQLGHVTIVLWHFASCLHSSRLGCCSSVFKPWSQ